MNGYMRTTRICLVLIVVGGIGAALYACWSMWRDSISYSELEHRHALMSRHNTAAYGGWLTADDLNGPSSQAAWQYSEVVKKGLFLGRQMKQRAVTMLILSLSMSGIGLTGQMCLSRALRQLATPLPAAR